MVEARNGRPTVSFIRFFDQVNDAVGIPLFLDRVVLLAQIVVLALLSRRPKQLAAKIGAEQPDSVGPLAQGA